MFARTSFEVRLDGENCLSSRCLIYTAYVSTICVRLVYPVYVRITYLYVRVCVILKSTAIRPRPFFNDRITSRVPIRPFILRFRSVRLVPYENERIRFAREPTFRRRRFLRACVFFKIFIILFYSSSCSAEFAICANRHEPTRTTHSANGTRRAVFASIRARIRPGNDSWFVRTRIRSLQRLVWQLRIAKTAPTGFIPHASNRSRYARGDSALNSRLKISNIPRHRFIVNRANLYIFLMVRA